MIKMIIVYKFNKKPKKNIINLLIKIKIRKMSKISKSLLF